MKRFINIVFCIVLAACGSEATTAAPVQSFPSPTALPSKAQMSSVQFFTAVPSRTPRPATIALPSPKPSLTPDPSIPSFDLDAWKEQPVIPTVDPSISAIYEYGQRLGNDPNAFSIFGDCQTRPEEFFGVFETDEAVVARLSPELQEVVENFQGSFTRESSTSQDGTTPGSLLWTQWHRGEYGCSFAETPVECELRVHRPSFVIIQVGTHFESRNTEYLREIILQLMDEGVVPILATKADNREKDERINRDMWMLASEYDLPLWNFWAAVSDLPNRGLYTRSDRPLQGDIYLTEPALEIHRMTGLEALNVVWRVATKQ
ncbi:MAG TPA: hypothetical protein VHO49_02160 [Anaerolineales bacterium]|nr:hypothetical protein [Anaerolineales bacterium]